MIRLDTLADSIASRLLARHGVALIWDLQVAAAIVHSTGDPDIAAAIIEIAEAAERECLLSPSAHSTSDGQL